MLTLVNKVIQKSCYMLKFIEYFTYDEFKCLVVEHLDTSLWDLMKEPGIKPMSLKLIRPIAKQVCK